MTSKPLILGIGGTPRLGSSSERALAASLAAANTFGADTLMIAGPELVLPMYNPADKHRSVAAQKLIDAFRKCDGIIISSPAYHGSISGLVKNALDYTEDLREDARVYFDGIAVGCIACAGGWQAAGQTLSALRSIAHALRAWPTPLGGMLNTSMGLFDDQGRCVDLGVKMQLETIGTQVAGFALTRKTDASQKSPASASAGT